MRIAEQQLNFKAVTQKVFSFRQTLFLLLHIPLGLAMHEINAASTFHGWGTIVLAIIVALRSTRVEPILLAAAYVAGCEVLWRMTGAEVFWETAKYVIILIFGIGLLRFRSQKTSLLPVIYFCLLLPSALIPLFKLSPADAREALSFNLAGPLAFTVSAIFLSRLWLSEDLLQRMLRILIGPVIGIATLTIYSTLTANRAVLHGTESLMRTSGGFGPNQVSAILGLAGLFCYLLFLMNRCATVLTKIVLIALWFGFTLESALTYSRGGIYMELAAAGLASYYAYREKIVRFSLFLFLLLVAAIASILLVPYLDQISSGSFSDRYTSVDPTGRDILILDDLNAFARNPLIGIGVGMSEYFRSLIRVTAHTEYTRLLGEHGMFGVMALGLFFFMVFHRWRNADVGKPVLNAFLLWGVLFLSIYATRLSAPVLLMGVPFASFLKNRSRAAEEQPSAASEPHRLYRDVPAPNLQTLKTRNS